MIERLASFFKKELALFIEKKLPVAEGGLVSVTNVFINESADRAMVFVSIFPEKIKNEVLFELKHLESAARKFLSSKLKRRQIPKIVFLFDRGYNAEAEVERLLKK